MYDDYTPMGLFNYQYVVYSHFFSFSASQTVVFVRLSPLIPDPKWKYIMKWKCKYIKKDYEIKGLYVMYLHRSSIEHNLITT